MYCDSTLVLDKKSNGLFPLDGLCKGATKIEIWGGGHCGSCFIDGNQLTVLPYAKQPSLLLDTHFARHAGLVFFWQMGLLDVSKIRLKASSSRHPDTGDWLPDGLMSFYTSFFNETKAAY